MVDFDIKLVTVISLRIYICVCVYILQYIYTFQLKRRRCNLQNILLIAKNKLHNNFKINSNFKNPSHLGENDLNDLDLILLLLPPCFIYLDIILIHDDLDFSSSVVILGILRISATSEA